LIRRKQTRPVTISPGGFAGIIGTTTSFASTSLHASSKTTVPVGFIVADIRGVTVGLGALTLLFKANLHSISTPTTAAGLVLVKGETIRHILLLTNQKSLFNLVTVEETLAQSTTNSVIGEASLGQEDTQPKDVSEQCKRSEGAYDVDLHDSIEIPVLDTI
jgi:hypothetical protein